MNTDDEKGKPNLRRLSALVPINLLTDGEFDQLLTAPSVDIRLSAIQREERVLSPEQVERALHDSDFLVRSFVIKRGDVILTDEQIDGGLCDPA